jgi:hypothetical protein
MATYTPNLNLKKPAGSETASITDINDNMDKVDTAVGALQGKIVYKSGDEPPENPVEGMIWLKPITAEAEE